MIPAVLGVMSRIAQFGINKLAIDEQNRYNSPVAQMGRYKRAGLNPALLYQRVEPGLQNQANRYSDSTLSKDIVDSYNAEINSMNAETNRMNAETQRSNSESDSKVKNEQAESMRLANNNARKLQEYIDKNPDSFYLPQVKKYLAEYNKLLADIRNTKSDTDLKEQQHEINRINQDLYETKFWQDMERGQEEINEIKARTSKLKVDKNLSQKQIDFLNKDIENYAGRYLTQPEPWYAQVAVAAIKKMFGLKDDDNETAVDALNDAIDQIENETKEVKDKAKKKLAVTYHGSYQSHDDQYTYGVIKSGDYKGQKYKVEQKTGEIIFY